MSIANFAMTWGVTLLAPLLICFALAIISGLVYMFFGTVLPLIEPKPFTITYCIHVAIAMFLLFNVMFNYFLCVTTKHTGESYEIVVRELAEQTNFDYPEDEHAVQEYEASYKKRMRERHRRMRERRNRANNDDSSDSDSDSGRPAWVLLGSHEWGFCMRSKQPKPPRSHYDHALKELVLNMDHYCPWMANCVGYFNYRYFLNFLIYVFVAMVYAVSITFNLFLSIDNHRRHRVYTRNQEGNFDPGAHIEKVVDPRYADLSKEERQTISFAFLICVAVGVGVFVLMAFHLYLACSGQTTIELHSNFGRKRRARHRGVMWSNPYDLGWKRNLMQIYGELSFKAFLPSAREPTYLPLPIPGERGKRKRFAGVGKRDEGVGVEMGGAEADMGGFEAEEKEKLIQRGAGRGQKPMEVMTV